MITPREIAALYSEHKTGQARMCTEGQRGQKWIYVVAKEKEIGEDFNAHEQIASNITVSAYKAYSYCDTDVPQHTPQPQDSKGIKRSPRPLFSTDMKGSPRPQDSKGIKRSPRPQDSTDIKGSPRPQDSKGIKRSPRQLVSTDIKGSPRPQDTKGIKRSPRSLVSTDIKGSPRSQDSQGIKRSPRPLVSTDIKGSPRPQDSKGIKRSPRPLVSTDIKGSPRPQDTKGIKRSPRPLVPTDIKGSPRPQDSKGIKRSPRPQDTKGIKRSPRPLVSTDMPSYTGKHDKCQPQDMHNFVELSPFKCPLDDHSSLVLKKSLVEAHASKSMHNVEMLGEDTCDHNRNQLFKSKNLPECGRGVEVIANKRESGPAFNQSKHGSLSSTNQQHLMAHASKTMLANVKQCDKTVPEILLEHTGNFPVAAHYDHKPSCQRTSSQEELRQARNRLHNTRSYSKGTSACQRLVENKRWRRRSLLEPITEDCSGQCLGASMTSFPAPRSSPCLSPELEVNSKLAGTDPACERSLDNVSSENNHSVFQTVDACASVFLEIALGNDGNDSVKLEQEGCGFKSILRRIKKQLTGRSSDKATFKTLAVL